MKLAPDVFVAHVRERLDGATLDKLHLSRIRDFVARIDSSPAFADEVRQRLSEKLLSDDDGRAGKLSQYTGKGPLGGWIRVAAVLEAQNTRRGTKHVVDPADVALASPEADPEIQLLERKYAREFKEAFATVLASISQTNATCAASITSTASPSSRATAARWLAEAKTRIVSQVESALAKKLGKKGTAKGPTAESLLALVRSQLDLRLRKHF